MNDGDWHISKKKQIDLPISATTEEDFDNLKGIVIGESRLKFMSGTTFAGGIDRTFQIITQELPPLEFNNLLWLTGISFSLSAIFFTGVVIYKGQYQSLRTKIDEETVRTKKTGTTEEDQSSDEG